MTPRQDAHLRDVELRHYDFRHYPTEARLISARDAGRRLRRSRLKPDLHFVLMTLLAMPPRRMMMMRATHYYFVAMGA